MTGEKRPLSLHAADLIVAALVRKTVSSALIAVVAFAALFLAPSGATPSLAATQEGSSDARTAAERGMAAYLATRYAEALPDLEKARDGGVATGPLLYMLGFCYQSLKHDAQAASTAFDAADTALQAEIKAEKPALESYFYLSNLLINRNDPEGSRKIALEGTEAIDKKKIKVGKDGIAQFRAGKLYADAGNAAKAVEYQRRAVEAFAKEEAPPPEYLRRSLETLARAGDRKIDPALVVRTWERLLKANPSIPNGDRYLALANLRAGNYAAARDQFEKMRQAGGEASQDYFYLASLAGAAQDLAAAGFKIPDKDPKRGEIAALDDAALDQLVTEYAKQAGELLARPATAADCEVGLTKKGVKRVIPAPKLAREIGDSQRYFVAAVIVIAGRADSLQAKAFEGGYAALVIQNWTQLWRGGHRDLIESLLGTPQNP